MLHPATVAVPPVSSDYTPQGSEVTLGDLTIYEAKDKSPKIMLICAYDIFGFHPNAKQFTDKLNSTGLFRVIMPEFFRGKGYTEETWPPKDRRSEVMTFVATTGSWDKVVKQDVINIIQHYQKQGVSAFGIFGFCWGGEMAIRAACEVESIKGAVLIHPSLIDEDDAKNAKAPVLFIITKDKPDMIPFYEIVKKNLGEGKADHHRLDDMFHGYAGARGDWKIDLQRKRVDETIALTHSFFKKHLSVQ